MAGTLTRHAYEELIEEDLRWLESLPRTLERDHVIMIVRASADHEYGATKVVEAEKVYPWTRSCNRHTDCDKADRDTILGHGRPADHCDDECCEDCFGY